MVVKIMPEIIRIRKSPSQRWNNTEIFSTEMSFLLLLNGSKGFWNPKKYPPIQMYRSEQNTFQSAITEASIGGTECQQSYWTASCLTENIRQSPPPRIVMNYSMGEKRQKHTAPTQVPGKRREVGKTYDRKQKQVVKNPDFLAELLVGNCRTTAGAAAPTGSVLLGPFPGVLSASFSELMRMCWRLAEKLPSIHSGNPARRQVLDVVVQIYWTVPSDGPYQCYWTATTDVWNGR